MHYAAASYRFANLEDSRNRNNNAGSLTFESLIRFTFRNTQAIFIAAATPMGDYGHADLNKVKAAAFKLSRSLDLPAPLDGCFNYSDRGILDCNHLHLNTRQRRRELLHAAKLQ